MSQQNFLFVDRGSPIFSPNVEGIVVDQVFFQMFDTPMHSGDIRDQSQKLSKIAPKLSRLIHWILSQILNFCHSIFFLGGEGDPGPSWGVH